MKLWLPDVLAGVLIIPFTLAVWFLVWVFSIPQP